MHKIKGGDIMYDFNCASTQYYPKEGMNFLQRIQNIINEYYANDTRTGQIGEDTPEDDVTRLNNNLSTFPKCINEYIDKELVDKLSINLPEDDALDLHKKHDEKCKEALDNVRRAIHSIETYSAMTGMPHLFRKEEINEDAMKLPDEQLLDLIVKVIIDMYGEEQIPAKEYIANLVEERQKLDTTLLSLDYE